jgi:hypothetical protein
LAIDPMDTDETDAEKNYIPLKESVVNDTAIDEEFLVETIDLIFNNPSLRNISVYSYALLKKFGVNSTDIRNFFPKIGLHKKQTCRENVIKLKNSNFEIKSGG